MNRQYIDDYHVVARYLADQLSDAERGEFEAYFLEHPDMVEELEQVARIKAGLMRLRATGELTSLLRPKPWYTQWRSAELRRAIGGSLAAMVLIAVGAALWWNRHSGSTERWLAPTPAALLGPLGKPLPAGNTYTILRTRGETDVDIELPRVPQAVMLRVLPESVAQPAIYRITLYSMDGAEPREVAAVDGLTANEDEFVPVYVDASKVGKGRYRLAIEGVAQPESRSVFAVRFY